MAQAGRGSQEQMLYDGGFQFTNHNMLWRLSPLQKLGVPVRNIDCIQERKPFTVSLETESFHHEGGPGGPLGEAEKHHSGLLGSHATFSQVASVAAAHDVGPGRSPTPRSGDDVIKVKLASWQPPPTILARALVPCIDVEATEPDLAFWEAIKSNQKYHPRNPDRAVHQPQPFLMDRDRELTPTLKIEGLILLVHRFDDALIKQREGASYRRDLNGDVDLVENQDPRVEDWGCESF